VTGALLMARRASGKRRQAPVKLETPNSRHYLLRNEAFTSDL
jgi:hypothetical protein